MTNRYGGRCSCGAIVDAGAGGAFRSINGEWRVVCRPCIGPEPERGTISLGLSFDGFIVCVPSLTLTTDWFDHFRRACHAAGIRYQKSLSRNVAPLDHYPNVTSSLKGEGFHIVVDPKLALALETKAAHMRVARNLAHDRASEIDKALQEKGQKLWPFQPEGAAFLAMRRGALLHDEPGLGKTVQTLAAIHENAPVLVVGPAAARSVWQRHVPIWRPDLKAEALEGLKSFRWPAPGELLATTWACLPQGEEAGGRLIAPPGAQNGTHLVADEAHVLLNPHTLQSKRFRALARAVKASHGYIWLLTGTPVLNARPMEIWNLLASVPGMPEEAYGDFIHYLTLWGGRMEEGGKPKFPQFARPSKDVSERLKKVALGRKRAEVMPDLPPDFDADIIVPLKDPGQRKLLDDAKDDIDRMLDKVAAASADELQKIGSLDTEEAASRIATARRLLADVKAKALVDWIHEYEALNEPIVVFSAHRTPLLTIADREKWGLIVGGVSPDKRGHLEDEFQAGRLRGLACSIKAGGVALTLTRAAFGFFIDWEWVPALNKQARDRLVRGTQKRGVLFRHFVVDHEIDRKIRDVCAWKNRVNEQAVTHSPASGGVEDHIRAFEVKP